VSPRQAPEPEPNETKYYLVGRVPVKMQERPDGVALVAFNPLLGGFVADVRYYSAIKWNEDGRVQEIDEGQFEREVERLRRSEFYPADVNGST